MEVDLVENVYDVFDEIQATLRKTLADVQDGVFDVNAEEAQQLQEHLNAIVDSLLTDYEMQENEAKVIEKYLEVHQSERGCEENPQKMHEKGRRKQIHNGSSTDSSDDEGKRSILHQGRTSSLNKNQIKFLLKYIEENYYPQNRNKLQIIKYCSDRLNVSFHSVYGFIRQHSKEQKQKKKREGKDRNRDDNGKKSPVDNDIYQDNSDEDSDDLDEKIAELTQKCAESESKFMRRKIVKSSVSSQREVGGLGRYEGKSKEDEGDIYQDSDDSDTYR